MSKFIRKYLAEKISSQKMSILYAQKIRDVDEDNPSDGIDFKKLNYPVFLASVNGPESKSGQVCDWLDQRLDVVFEQWQEWLNANQLKSIPAIKVTTEIEGGKKPKTIPLFEEKGKEEKPSLLKPKEVKSETKISKFLEDIFS